MSELFVSNRNESVRMFRRDWMEATTYVHPAVPHVIYLPVVVWLLVTSPVPPARTGLWFLGGLFVWTFLEYILHRFIFHAPPAVMRETHEIVATLAPGDPVIPALPGWRHVLYFIFHGVHHEYPSDARRLVMPPVASIPMAIVVWLLFSWALGPAARAAFAGLLVGYLVYDTTHFVVHHYSVPTRFGKFLKRHHFRHHFKSPDRDYGVSSPLWDFVFRTFVGDRRSPRAEVGASR